MDTFCQICHIDETKTFCLTDSISDHAACQTVVLTLMHTTARQVIKEGVKKKPTRLFVKNIFPKQGTSLSLLVSSVSSCNLWPVIHTGGESCRDPGGLAVQPHSRPWPRYLGGKEQEWTLPLSGRPSGRLRPAEANLRRGHQCQVDRSWPCRDGQGTGNMHFFLFWGEGARLEQNGVILYASRKSCLFVHVTSLSWHYFHHNHSCSRESYTPHHYNIFFL